MEKQDIHLGDWKRILLGNAPPEFLLEVFIRTFLLYIVLLIIIKWLGKRMSGQLTILELAVMLTIGAVVSAPMQVPDRGILQGVVLLLCLLALQRGISLLGFLSNRFENLTQGRVSMLVKNGVMQLDAMKNESISREQLFAQLRTNNIYNLGNVERMYLEACGMYSIYKTNTPQPGLVILPLEDHDISRQITHTVNKSGGIVTVVCVNCGLVQRHDGPPACTYCQHTDWQPAIIDN